MKNILILLIVFLGFTCLQKEKEFNGGKSNDIPKKEINFVRLLDTVSASFYLDSTYSSIGSTIDSYGSDYNFNYSNGVDSVYILSYSSVYALPFDSISFKHQVFSNSRMLKHSEIKNLVINERNGTTLATYYDIRQKRSYIICVIYDQHRKIFFKIIYQTHRITDNSISAFNKMLNSFCFESKPKRN